jgi:hypothetical protein
MHHLSLSQHIVGHVETNKLHICDVITIDAAASD